MVLRLVRCRAVLPDFPVAVEVNRPKLADFARTTAREALEADHIGDDLRQVWERGLNERLVNGQDRGRLAGGGAADT